MLPNFTLIKKYGFLLSTVLIGKCFSISISTYDANKVGERIWKNECGGTVEGLVHWNKGESFPSLGIGHFIWYTSGQKELFQQTFPDLLAFLHLQGATFPIWLKVSSDCPWNSREEFVSDVNSSKINSLRQFLFETRGLQAIFMANRLKNILPDLISNCSIDEKKKINIRFALLVKDPNGLYALMDYLNFKGAGIAPSESYKGQGWGLLQVLLHAPSSSNYSLRDFVEAAKYVLTLRVQNSPPERNEGKWLSGWLNRLDTYLLPSP